MTVKRRTPYQMRRVGLRTCVFHYGRRHAAAIRQRRDTQGSHHQIKSMATSRAATDPLLPVAFKVFFVQVASATALAGIIGIDVEGETTHVRSHSRSPFGTGRGAHMSCSRTVSMARGSETDRLGSARIGAVGVACPARGTPATPLTPVGALLPSPELSVIDAR